jgi:phosphohistidine swiveling domain-containing protein
MLYAPLALNTIVDLESVHRAGPARAGGKAAGLGRLIRLGLPVPPGFCILAGAYREHVSGRAVRPRLDEALAALAAGDPGRRVEALAALRQAIVETPVPPRLREAVSRALDALARRAPRPLRLAVRSSALAEDLPGRSFAGQHRTDLGIEGLDGCLASVAACWASLWTEGAAAYRERAGVPHRDAAMAVVVQALVPAEAAGVLFTADPSNGRRDRIAIESVPGLGEPLVAGRASPDRLVLRRPDLEVVERSVAEKRSMAAAAPGGGIEERPLDPDRARAPSLDDDRARLLARLAFRAEKGSGVPLDIEWASDGAGRIAILQARPITSLPERSWEDRQVWTDLNTGEVMPDVVTPFSWSIAEPLVRNLLGRVFEKMGLDVGDHPIIGLVAGRVYFNLNTVAACCRRVPGMGDGAIAKLFGGRADLVAGLAALGPEDLPDVRFHPLRLAARLPGLALSILLYSPARAEALGEWARRLMDEEMAVAPEALSKAEIHARLARNLVHLRLDRTAIDAVFPGMAWISSLFKACGRWLGSEGDAVAGRLLAGLGTNEIARAALDLGRLARAVREDPALERAVLDASTFGDLRERISGTDAGARFLESWEGFLSKHGHHCRGEVEVANPRWAEAPDEVLAQLRGCVRAAGGDDIIARFDRLGAARAEAEAEVRRRLGPLRRAIFARLLRKARRMVPLRENYKNQLVRGLAFLRRFLLELGGRLAAEGPLDRREDIFFLTAAEVRALGEGGLDPGRLRALAAPRRAEHEANSALRPPQVVVGRFDPMRDDPPPATAEGSVLTGLGVHPGVVRGTARVILRSGEDEVRPGEVLVAPFTDPGWTPYFLNAAAVVVDTGGVLSHGSIVARELGIPTVVNAGPATRLIRTGRMVEVDGARGTVRLL